MYRICYVYTLITATRFMGRQVFILHFLINLLNDSMNNKMGACFNFQKAEEDEFELLISQQD